MNTIEELMRNLPKRSQKKLQAIMAEAEAVVEARKPRTPKTRTMYHLCYEWSEPHPSGTGTWRHWEWICSLSREALLKAVPEGTAVTHTSTNRVKNGGVWTKSETAVTARNGGTDWVL